MIDRCQWARCRDESRIVYLGVGMCDRHWERYATEEGNHLNAKAKKKIEKELKSCDERFDTAS